MHVLLYTTSSCSFCERARALLDGRGIEYVEQSLDGDRPMSERLRVLFGRATMPYVLIDGEAIGGLEELEQLARAGELG